MLAKMKRQARAIIENRGHCANNWQNNALTTRHASATLTCSRCGRTVTVMHGNAFGDALNENCISTVIRDKNNES